MAIRKANEGGLVRTVLFVSTKNAGRTQMAAAWFNALAHPQKARATSAGIAPARATSPLVLAALRDLGIALGASEPKLLTPTLTLTADVVIVIGPPALELPPVRARDRDEWLVGEIDSAPAEVVRSVGQAIERLVRDMLAKRAWMPIEASPASVPPARRAAS